MMNRNQFVKWMAVLFVLMLAGCDDTQSPASTGSVSSLSDLSLAASSDVTPPSAPSNLMWTNDGMTVTLTWGASTDDVGVVSYDLWYGSFFLGTFSDTTLSLIGFKAGTQYTFTVKARDAAGNTSVASNQTTVILGQQVDSTPPSAPGNLRSTNVTSSSVSLAWNASSDDTGVVVYHVYSNGQIVANPTSTSANVTGLSSSTSYTFTVTAQDATGNLSNTSSPLSVTTLQGVDTIPPSAPSGLVASNVTDTSLTLSWSASTDNVGVASYTVFNGSVVAASNLTGLSASITGLSSGVTYTFSVVAKDAAGNTSSSSNSVQVTPQVSTYTLTIAAGTGGTTSPAAGTYSYATGTTVSVTANPSSGYGFSGWSGAASGTSNPVSIVMTGNKTLTAAFAATPSSLSINVGGAATGSFVADEYFTGGTTYSNTNTIDTSLVSSAVPAAVFQSERYGPFTYTIPGLTAGSPYVVTLYFAETYLSAAGARLFDVAINGSKVLSGFDIYATAGAQNKAIAQSFNATADGSGQVTIAFTTGAVENPKVCGITVAPGSLPTYTLTATKSGSGTGTVSGGGLNCGSTCTANVVSGSVVTLTASPDGNSTFSGWSGACSGTSLTCNVTMSAAQTVTAAFILGGAPGPCDIYSSGGTPCVAAHSTVRALYKSYSGSLYQVRRSSDSSTKDIGVLSAGGYANAATQDSFCSGLTCVITIIYDQSGRGNHLTQAPAGGAAGGPDNLANATAAQITMGGHKVYGVYVAAGTGYRNNQTSGIATGDNPEGLYAIFDGTHVNNGCCFDYGNAETSSTDTGAGHMEAIYFGTEAYWGYGAGSGPWVMADLENGLFSGQGAKYNASDLSITYRYVTAIVKGEQNLWAIRAGNAQSGGLSTYYSGARPSGYTTMHKEGAIILGIGGDNSKGSAGTFYEGALTSGYPSDSTENSLQANIVAAGYGN